MNILRRIAVMASAACLAGCASAPPEPTTVRVNLFQGASNIGIYVAESRGMLAKRGVKLAIAFTPNSDLQREGLAAGKFDIAHSAIDNAVAM